MAAHTADNNGLLHRRFRALPAGGAGGLVAGSMGRRDMRLRRTSVTLIRYPTCAPLLNSRYVLSPVLDQERYA